MPDKKPVYRYIDDWPWPDGPDELLSGYALVSGSRLSRHCPGFAIRLLIPHGTNPYKTTIGQLSPVAVARVDGRYRPIEGLWPNPMDTWPERMAAAGYRSYQDGWKTSWTRKPIEDRKETR